jgi:hypothetical protein
MGQWVPRHDGPYTFDDRYRDVWAVFNGTSTPEQGQRVLSQIMRLCEGPLVTPDKADDAGFLAYVAGMRYVHGQIMRLFMPPPKIEPDTYEDDA